MHTAKLIPQGISCTAYWKQSLTCQGIFWQDSGWYRAVYFLGSCRAWSSVSAISLYCLRETGEMSGAQVVTSLYLHWHQLERTVILLLMPLRVFFSVSHFSFEGNLILIQKEVVPEICFLLIAP